MQVQSPFWLLACCFIGSMCVRTALMIVACLEAQCIVFVAQGLLLPHELNPTAEFGMKLNIPFAAPLIDLCSKAQTHRLCCARIAPRAFVDRSCGIRGQRRLTTPFFANSPKERSALFADDKCQFQLSCGYQKSLHRANSP